MSLKNTLRLYIIFIIVCALSPVTLFFIIPSSAGATHTIQRAQTINEVSAVRIELPSRIKIEKLGIDADLEYVGVTEDGLLGVPRDPAHAAWFDAGPRPGEIGNAVIDGHFGWTDNIPAIFDRLNELVPGDTIRVIDTVGSLRNFKVTKSKLYVANGDPSEVFTSNDGKAHLNLITCEGLWDETIQNYSGRLVVFTDLE